MPTNKKFYMNEYYQNNKDKFKEYNSKKETCIYCGKTCSKQNLNNHMKTRNCENNRDKYKYQLYLDALQKIDVNNNITTDTQTNDNITIDKQTN